MRDVAGEAEDGEGVAGEGFGRGTGFPLWGAFAGGFAWDFWGGCGAGFGTDFGAGFGTGCATGFGALAGVWMVSALPGVFRTGALDGRLDGAGVVMVRANTKHPYKAPMRRRGAEHPGVRAPRQPGMHCNANMNE